MVWYDIYDMIYDIYDCCLGTNDRLSTGDETLCYK